MRNSEVINNWIREGNCIEPFRALYPEEQEVSYIPFRNVREGVALTGKSRLDFFLVHPDLIDKIGKIKYEHKLSHDFDHKMVFLQIGGNKKSSTVRIFNDTLGHELSSIIGTCNVMDTINSHLADRNLDLSVQIGNMIRLIKEYFSLELVSLEHGRNEQVNIRLNEVKNRLDEMTDLIQRGRGIDEFLELEFTCNYKLLYEAVANNLRNGLLELQYHIKKIKTVKRDLICTRLERMEIVFGRESDQFFTVLLELNNFDTNELRQRASKYREFVIQNNEKPTRAFCLLGKENNVLDDIDMIQDDDGNDFVNNESRKEYIRKYYENLYKKKNGYAIEY